MKVPILSIALFFCSQCFAQSTTQQISAADDYAVIANKRADKVLSQLNITDAARLQRVKSMIAGQYIHLNNIQAEQEKNIQLLKQKTEDKELVQVQAKEVADRTAKRLDSLHSVYISALSKELSKEQVEAVKNGMTYNILPITYSAYQDMLPSLTSEQKRQILTYLTEAREKAMDAGSSDEKHKWFGKYKGKINNYLSAQGYNMKKEGEAWQARIKERKAQTK